MRTREKKILVLKRNWIFIGFGAIVCLFIASISIWYNQADHSSYKHPSGEDYLAVNAPLDTSIKFSFESVKPEFSGESYFVNYRLERDKFRQETKEMLSALLNSRIEQTQAEAQIKWLNLSQSIKQEGEIENILKMKGFDDVVANVNKDSVNVIILSPALNPNSIALIQDVVMRITSVRLDRIYISVRH